MEIKRFIRKRNRPQVFLMCLILALLLNACLVQTTVPAGSATPLVLTPGALGSDTGQLQELLKLLPTALVEDAGDAPILITPAALHPEGTPVDPATLTTPSPLASTCGRSDAITLIILGIDENAQADAIRLARIDFSKPEINLIAIPSDFFVSIVGFEGYGIEKGRINATFGYGEYFFGAGNGAESLAENLAYNFGVEVDHQFVLHLAEIANYIDAAGGVDVSLETSASDSYNYFPAGLNHFNGERAVAFMRVRQHDSDFRRIDRQTVVLKALLDKVRGGLNPIKVFNLIMALLKDDSTQSDLTLRDMQSFYCLSQQIDKASIHVREIPSEMFHTYITPGGGWVLIPHKEVPEYIRESLAP